MRVYATTDDLSAWTGTPAPENAGGLLRSASGLVEAATRNAVYTVTPEGMPTHPTVSDAFRDATSAQAAYWAANSLDPTGGALAVQSERVASSKSIKGASVSWDTGDATRTKDARAQALTTLCHEAWGILMGAGLVTAVLQ